MLKDDKGIILTDSTGVVHTMNQISIKAKAHKLSVFYSIDTQKNRITQMAIINEYGIVARLSKYYNNYLIEDEKFVFLIEDGVLKTPSEFLAVKTEKAQKKEQKKAQKKEQKKEQKNDRPFVTL